MLSEKYKNGLSSKLEKNWTKKSVVSVSESLAPE